MLCLYVGDARKVSARRLSGHGYSRRDGSGGSESFKDGGVALQGIVGARYAVSPNIDVGLKYRYFRSSRIKEDIEDDEFLRGGRFKSRCHGPG